MGRLGALHDHGMQVPLSVCGFAFASVLALSYPLCALQDDAQNLFISNDTRHLFPMWLDGFDARIRLGLLFLGDVTGSYVPPGPLYVRGLHRRPADSGKVCRSQLGTLEMPKQPGGWSKEEARRRVVLQRC